MKLIAATLPLFTLGSNQVGRLKNLMIDLAVNTLKILHRSKTYLGYSNKRVTPPFKYSASFAQLL